MDHDALKLFLHLSESLHFGRTSRACNISPSALSRQIQRMERAVGDKLFARDNRSVALTPAGVSFREYAQAVMEKWQDFLDELATEKNTLRGEIRFYCSVTASLSIMPDLLEAFKTRYPAVQIRLHTGDASLAMKKVVEGEVDMAVSALPDRMPNTLAFMVLTRVSLDFIAPRIAWDFSREMDKEKKIPWGRIPMILSEKGVARQRIDAWFQRKAIQPNIYAQVSGNEAILSMVSLGCGVGVVPRLVIDNSPLKERVVRLKVAAGPEPYTVGICVQKRKLTSRLVRSFWDIVNEPNPQ